jgi:integrase
MRRGWTFKRCCRCGARVSGDECQRCRWQAFTWSYVLDIAPAGFPRHQKKQGGFVSEGEAAAAMRRLQLHPDGHDLEDSTLTTGQYLRDWMRDTASGGSIRPTTAKAYDVAIRVHIVPRLGRVPLRELSRRLIKEFYEFLRIRGMARGRAGALSRKSVYNIHLTLHRALEDALDDGLLLSNPAARAYRMGHNRREVRCWTSAELRRFLLAAENDPNFALWRLAASTGMRRGELLGLRWRDIDLDRGLVTVQRQLLRNGKEVGFGQPKTAAGRRTVCLDPTTADALGRHRDRQVAKTDSTVGSLDLVFCRRDGRPRDPDAVSHQFADQIRELGLPHIRLHDLRHTHASLALQAGINPKVVQERLGHASVSVTLDTYTHLLAPIQAEAAIRIAALVDAS